MYSVVITVSLGLNHLDNSDHYLRSSQACSRGFQLSYEFVNNLGKGPNIIRFRTSQAGTKKTTTTVRTSAHLHISIRDQLWTRVMLRNCPNHNSNIVPTLLTFLHLGFSPPVHPGLRQKIQTEVQIVMLRCTPFLYYVRKLHTARTRRWSGIWPMLPCELDQQWNMHSTVLMNVKTRHAWKRHTVILNRIQILFIFHLWLQFSLLHYSYLRQCLFCVTVTFNSRWLVQYLFTLPENHYLIFFKWTFMVVYFCILCVSFFPPLNGRYFSRPYADSNVILTHSLHLTDTEYSTDMIFVCDCFFFCGLQASWLTD